MAKIIIILISKSRKILFQFRLSGATIESLSNMYNTWKPRKYSSRHLRRLANYATAQYEQGMSQGENQPSTSQSPPKSEQFDTKTSSMNILTLEDEQIHSGESSSSINKIFEQSSFDNSPTDDGMQVDMHIEEQSYNILENQSQLLTKCL